MVIEITHWISVFRTFAETNVCFRIMATNQKRLQNPPKIVSIIRWGTLLRLGLKSPSRKSSMRTNDWGRLGSCYLVAFLIERCCFSNTCSTSRASQGATALSKFQNTVSGIGMAKATSDQFNFQVSSGLRQLVALPPECSRSESLLFKRGDLKLTSKFGMDNFPS
jgi:hypothetical protein